MPVTDRVELAAVDDREQVVGLEHERAVRFQHPRQRRECCPRSIQVRQEVMVDDQVEAVRRRGSAVPRISHRASAEARHHEDPGAVGGQPARLGGVDRENRRLDPTLREERAEVAAVARQFEHPAIAGGQTPRDQLADHGARVRRDRRRRGRRRGRRIVDLVRPVAVQLREAAPGAQHEREGEERHVEASEGAGYRPACGWLPRSRTSVVRPPQARHGTDVGARHHRARPGPRVVTDAGRPSRTGSCRRTGRSVPSGSGHADASRSWRRAIPRPSP